MKMEQMSSGNCKIEFYQISIQSLASNFGAISTCLTKGTQDNTKFILSLYLFQCQIYICFILAKNQPLIIIGWLG